MTFSLRDRVLDYQDRANLYLLPKVPVIIELNGRSFSKTTALIDKPYSQSLMEVFSGVLIKLCQEVEGVQFGLTFNDRLVLVCRNDQNPQTIPWYDNNTQLVTSAAASLATYEFNQLIALRELPIVGAPIFTGACFTVPSIVEVVNTLCYYQQQCFHSSITNACFYELIKSNDAEDVKRTLEGKNPNQKNEILVSQCGITFNDYPVGFKRGVGCYRAAKINNQKEVKYKLTLDTSLPLFSQSKDWLYSIFNSGGDIVRVEN